MAGISAMEKKLQTRVSISEDGVLKELPPRLMSCLMTFQKEGVLFSVKKDGRCLIADEMGLGKTLQAIAVAYYFRSEWPLLIIVPSSLRYAWIEELEKWLPCILPQDINLIQGGFDTGGIGEAKITIVTYGLLSCKSSAAVKEALLAKQFGVVICDESHYFKNSRTECCKAVVPLLTASKRCVLLSGTPALAKPAELFTQLDALQPGKFGSFWSFTKKYCAGHWQHFGRRRQWRADGASNLEELQQRLKSVMIRREKSSVLTQLPPKQRQKILFPLKDSHTKKEILSVFADLKPLLKKSKSSLASNLLGDRDADRDPEGVHGAQHTDTNILSRIQRLYNLTADAKIGPAREYIQMLCEDASLKFLVFAYHHNMMDGLQQTLWDKKIKFVRIDGQTKPSDRQLYVQQFQSDKNTRVAILSILAAGVGLTLTAASLVVFAELYWTPGVMVQCEDRAHRIGQTSAVPVHYLVARETMDEWVWAAVCRKTLVTSAALTGKTKALKTDCGDRYQVELLSAAKAYTPADNADIDVAELVQSQLPPDQKSIMDFFSSQKSSQHVSPKGPTKKNRNRDSQDSDVDLSVAETDVTAVSSTPKDGGNKKSFPIFTSLKKPPKDFVIIDSSDGESENAEPNAPRGGKVTGKSDSSSRKRKCKVTDSEDDCSDLEFSDLHRDFKQSTPSLTHSGSKKKKLGAVSKKLSTPKLPSGIQRTTSADVSDKCMPVDLASVCSEGTSCMEKGGRVRYQWSCSACTFSNSTLLPFCEMCDTPRKEQSLAQRSRDTGRPSATDAGREKTAVLPSPVSNREMEIKLWQSSGPHGSQQCARQHSSFAGHATGTESGVSTASISSYRSKHRVNRHLMLDSTDEVRGNTDSSQPVEDEAHVSFKLNSSMEKDDELNSSIASESDGEAVTVGAGNGCSNDEDGHSRVASPSHRCSADQSSADQSSADQSSADQSSADQSSAGQSSAGQSSADQSSAGQSSAGQSSVDQSSAGQSSAGQSSADQSSAHQSSAGQSSADQSSADQSSAHQSSAVVQSESQHSDSSLKTCSDQTVNSETLSDSDDELSEASGGTVDEAGERNNRTVSAVRAPKRRSFMLGTPVKGDKPPCVREDGKVVETETDKPISLHSACESLQADLDGISKTSSPNGSLKNHDRESKTAEKNKTQSVCPADTEVKLQASPQRASNSCSRSRSQTDTKVKLNTSPQGASKSCSRSRSQTDTEVKLNMSPQGASKSGSRSRSATGDFHSLNEGSCAAAAHSTATKVSECEVYSEVANSAASAVQQGTSPVHSHFLFCCSSYTGRVYLFDKDGQSLKANFLPLDVELDNINELPGVLHHPRHLRLVQHFVRQWSSLTDTKRRLISKRGLMFQNPLAAYDTVRTDLTNNKQRYQTKEDQAKAALQTAEEMRGRVRVVTKQRHSAKTSSAVNKGKTENGGADASTQLSQGYVQVVSAEGVPLCVHCQQPCSSLLSKTTLTSEDQAWHTRFCSRVCADAHWMKTNTAYLRSSIYDVEHGVCQLCGCDAHTFFCQIRDNTDRKQRAEAINNNKFGRLAVGLKKQMIARPYEGLFWHVDHIRPVWEGGGQCDIDNLRTLCAPCHQTVTTKQAAKRAHVRKLSKAAFAGDITAFFKKL